MSPQPSTMHTNLSTFCFSLTLRQSVLAACLTLITLLAEAQVPAGAQIVGVNAMGNGCPPGSVSTSLSPDSQELSLLFDQFIAQSGGTSGNKVDKKICVMQIDFQVPAGYSMGLVSADYRGFAALEAGTMGQHEVLYSFNKSYAGSSFSSQSAQGPLNSNYLIHNELRAEMISWSVCHQPRVSLMIRTSLVAQSQGRASGPLPAALVTLDTVDAAVQQSFKIAWRPCSEAPGGGPVRPPTNSQTADVYQLFDGRDRFLTTDARLVERPGSAWVNQGLAFRLFRGPQMVRSAQALYSCIDDSLGLHFVSTESRCEGRRTLATLGFLAIQQEPGLVSLYQFISPSNPMHRIQTTSKQEGERAGFVLERIIGYVIQTRP